MSRTATLLGGILIVQIIVYALTSVKPHHVEKKEPFLAIDTSAVDYVYIRNADGELTMKRIGGNWKITLPYNYPANASYMKTLLEKAAELEIETFITDKLETFASYEVDDSSAAYVELGKEGGALAKFYCGKASTNYTHTYVRRAESNEVFLLSGTPRSSFTRRPKDWRDKAVLTLDKTMIERVRIVRPDETVELIRKISSPEEDTLLAKADTSWLASTARHAPFNPESGELNRILNTLGRLNAIDFLDADIDTIPSFASPEVTIEVDLEGDRHVTLDFIPKPDEETRWLARKNGDESTVYVIYQSSVKNLNKDVPTLKGEKKEDKDSA